MWEAEPTLVWRVKRNGKWRYERARFMVDKDFVIRVEPPKPPVNETDESGGESE